MNTNILKKVIDELTKEKPDVRYVLGMLETLYEMQGTADKNVCKPTSTAGGSPIKLPVNIERPETPAKELSEMDILEKQAQERLKNIKDIA